MLVNVPTVMPDLDRKKIHAFAKKHRIIDNFERETGKNGFFSEHDKVEVDFKRVYAQCAGMSEIELYNEILEIEL
jgi:hypothetical protein